MFGEEEKRVANMETEKKRRVEKNIPADVLIEILRRIDHQSFYDKRDLIALKSVSKFWKHVISNVYIPMICPSSPSAPFWGFLCFEDPPPPRTPELERFLKLYRSRSRIRPRNHLPSTNAKFLRLHFVGVKRFYEDLVSRIVRGHPRIEQRMLSLVPEERDPNDIQDCCNGLLLISYRHNQYYVGNPVTMQSLSIPLDPNHTTRPRHSSLVFDPSLTRCFKIVTFNGNINASSADHLELDIFSSETWGWSTRVIPNTTNNVIVASTDTWFPRSVYFNRALYYMSQSMYLVCIDNIITKGDDQSLRAWAIELPDRDGDEQQHSSCFGCIGSSSGSFYYSNRNEQGGSIFVWMLVDSKWDLTHSISVNGDFLRHGSLPPLSLFRPCGFFPNDDVVLISDSRLTFTYHLKTKVAKQFHEPLSCGCDRRILHLDGNSNYRIFPFSPCFLLLHHNTPQV